MKIEDYVMLEKINSGASSVEKYKVYRDGKYYLLRIYDARFMNSRYKALKNMENLFINDISVPKVYDKGLLNDKKGYALLEWLDGISLDKVLIDQKSEIQYGAEVASELLKMHSVNIADKIVIYDRFSDAFDKKIKKVSALDIEQKYIKLIQSFVIKNKNIFKELEHSCIIHGDFHPGNIIKNNNKLIFIDMDVCTISHPWEDLTSNACNMEFPNFYSSVIINYFKNDIPIEFWKVYKLFGALYTLDYILYTLRTEGKILEDGKKKLMEFLDFTDCLQSDVPNWFNKDIKVRRKYK